MVRAGRLVRAVVGTGLVLLGPTAACRAEAGGGAGSRTSGSEGLVPELIHQVSGHRLGRPWETLVEVAAIALACGVGWVAVDLGLWLSRKGFESLLERIDPAVRPRRRRSFETTQTFVRSGSRTALIVFGVVFVLYALGVDPLATTGALGVLGLVFAGLFRDMVNDFVTGFDIITGGHFYVGDFIEVAGQAGHVLDFNLKYTRLRLPGGQEVVLPNSQCVPSHRWPDGYVVEHVDLPLADRSQADEACRRLDALAVPFRRLRDRVLDPPALEGRFDPPTGPGIVVRYRIRVLPQSEAIVRGEFVPLARAALADAGIALAGEVTTSAMNDPDTFRKLFVGALTEAEIQRLAALPQPPPGGTHPGAADG